EVEPETSMASIEPGGEPFRPAGQGPRFRGRMTLTEVRMLRCGRRSLVEFEPTRGARLTSPASAPPAEQRARLSTLGLLGDELLHALHARRRSPAAVSDVELINRRRRLLCTRCQATRLPRRRAAT